MDSFTQIALGAAVGEATLGRKAGSKATAVGALAGLIPDLDVVFSPFLDPIQQLVFHRGLSHSLLFALLFAPFMAFMLHRFKPFRVAGVREWTLLVFLGLTTHALLDCFTTYGTGVFEPFSTVRVEFSSIFIIDLLYTLPLTAGVLAAMILRRAPRKAATLNWWGLGLSTAYLLFSLGLKMYADTVFAAALERQGKQFSEIKTVPTPFNNVLWHCIAKTESGFWTGHYSVFDSGEPQFTFVPRNEHLLDAYRSSRALRTLVFFSKDFYCLYEQGGKVYLNDMRFGALDAWETPSREYVFRYEVYSGAAGEAAFRPSRPAVGVSSEALLQLWRRIGGDTEPQTP